jgi:hypothetical protein
MENVRDVAAKKRERAKLLIANGMDVPAVAAAIEKEFGQGMSKSVLYAYYHEHHGTEPRQLKRRKRRKSAAPLAVVPKKPQPIDVQVTPTDPASPTVDALLSALLRAMRSEGVDSVMLRADGRATVYHVVSRDMQIGL